MSQIVGRIELIYVESWASVWDVVNIMLVLVIINTDMTIKVLNKY